MEIGIYFLCKFLNEKNLTFWFVEEYNYYHNTQYKTFKQLIDVLTCVNDVTGQILEKGFSPFELSFDWEKSIHNWDFWQDHNFFFSEMRRNYVINVLIPLKLKGITCCQFFFLILEKLGVVEEFVEIFCYNIQDKVMTLDDAKNMISKFDEYRLFKTLLSNGFKYHMHYKRNEKEKEKWEKIHETIKKECQKVFLTI